MITLKALCQCFNGENESKQLRVVSPNHKNTPICLEFRFPDGVSYTDNNAITDDNGEIMYLLPREVLYQNGKVSAQATITLPDGTIEKSAMITFAVNQSINADDDFSILMYGNRLYPRGGNVLRLVGDNDRYIIKFVGTENLGEVFAIFSRDNKTSKPILLNDDGSVNIPLWVLKRGSFEVGLYAEGFATTPLEIIVDESIIEQHGETIEDPEPSLVDQLLNKVNNIKYIKSCRVDSGRLIVVLNDDSEIDAGFIISADELSSIQSDWDQNDDSSPDYMKNRTHYKEVDSDGNIIYHTLDNKYLNLDNEVNSDSGNPVTSKAVRKAIDEETEKILSDGYINGSSLEGSSISRDKLDSQLEETLKLADSAMQPSVYDPQGLNTDVFKYAKERADEVQEDFKEIKDEIADAYKLSEDATYENLGDAVRGAVELAKSAAEEMLENHKSFTISIVDSLPDVGESNTFYLIQKQSGNGYDKYWYVTKSDGSQQWDMFGASSTIVIDTLPESGDEDVDYILNSPTGYMYYKWIDDSWKVIGGDFYTKSEIDALILGVKDGVETNTNDIKNNADSISEITQSLENIKTDIQANASNIQNNESALSDLSQVVADIQRDIDSIDGSGGSYYATYGKDTISGVQKDNVFTLYECKNGAESVKSQFVIEGGEGGSGGSYRVAYGKTVVDGELKDNVFTLYETIDGVETVKNQFVIEGGGGGSTTAKTEITLKKVTPSPIIISTNGKAEIEIDYSSVDKNGETYDAIYTWTKDSKVLETGALVQGKKKFDLTKYIALGTQKLVLTVVDDTGNSDSQTWTVQQVDMRIKSSFNDNNTFPIGRSVAYTYTPYGAIDKIVHFVLDGVEDTITISSSGTPLSYTIPPQSHGSHSFEVWMTSANDPNLKTEHLYYDIIWFDSGLTEPIISCIYRNDFYGTVDARQYDTTSIKYTVYDPTTDSPIVKRYADGELVNTDTLTKPTNEWKFKSDKIGEHTLIIEVGDNTEDGGWIVRDSVTIVMNINPLGIDVTPITANLEVDFNPIGITNNSSNRVWSNDKYHMTVSDNFDWINGGYRTDENGDTYFLVKAGTEAVLHYNIFSGDNTSSPSAFGAEMKIIFMTENVQKANAVWLKSVEQSNNSVVGIQMGVHEGWLKTNTASNVDVVGDNDSSFVAATNTYLYMPYSEEDIIEMDINIDPIDREASNPQAFVMAYEDGVPSKAFVYGSSDRFYHFEPKPITIGSNDCDVRIYRLKIYSSSLSTEDVMKNFIADSRDSTTMLQRYDRNSIYYDRETDTYTPYSSGGILDPEKLAPIVPNVKVLMLETDHFTTSKKDFVKAQLRCIHAVGGDKYSGDSYYDNWLFEDGWHAGRTPCPLYIEIYINELRKKTGMLKCKSEWKLLCKSNNTRNA